MNIELKNLISYQSLSSANLPMIFTYLIEIKYTLSQYLFNYTWFSPKDFHQCRKFIHKIFLYTGWIFGLSSENVESRSRLQRDSIASSSTTSTVLENNNAVQIKMEKLRRELEMLQTKVVEERERQFSNYKVWCYK